MSPHCNSRSDSRSNDRIVNSLKADQWSFFKLNDDKLSVIRSVELLIRNNGSVWFYVANIDNIIAEVFAKNMSGKSPRFRITK